MISKGYAVGNGARRRVNVTPVGTSTAERAVGPMTSAWRTYKTLLGIIFLAAFAFRYPGCYHIFGRGNAAPMHASKDFVLTQLSRGAFVSDKEAGGRELDSRIERVRATLPDRRMQGGVVI